MFIYRTTLSPCSQLLSAAYSPILSPLMLLEHVNNKLKQTMAGGNGETTSKL